MNFYEVVDGINPNRCNMAVTVLEGKYLGEKALLADYRLVWASERAGFFGQHMLQLEDMGNREEAEVLQGIVSVDGVRIFCELLGNEKKLVICGGGHVSIPIIQMGLMIGCHVTVLEDRAEFADHARQAGASEVICESFEEGLQRIEGDEDTFFIIVTRGHRYDQVCLSSIAKKPHAYIGMMGSRKRVQKVKETAVANGCDSQVIHRVCSPIGLDIKAETPEEIAIAVMAEIIEVKNTKRGTVGYPKEILRAILKGDRNLSQEQKPKVLATIIDKKGSAPRGIGTKMLVCADGSCVGTIGGGYAEAEITRRALVMIRGEEARPVVCRVDMTGRDEEEEGMACGGEMEVLLERVMVKTEEGAK